MGFLVENFGGTVVDLVIPVLNFVEIVAEGRIARSLPGSLVGLILWCAVLVANFGLEVVLGLPTGVVTVENVGGGFEV